MSKKIRSNKKRRICRFTGCTQVLSIYNMEPYCHAHKQAALTKELSAASASKY